MKCKESGVYFILRAHLNSDTKFSPQTLDLYLVEKNVYVPTLF